MSNPAVITLASMKSNKQFPYRFEIEDNIGEAIHIHYKDIRLDLTIQEFVNLADEIESVVNDLVEAEGFTCDKFDKVNLVGLAPLLPDLERIVVDEVSLSDLIVDTYDENGKSVYRPLPQSRIVKALNGATKENDAREQVNYYNANGSRQTNMERLQYNLEKLKKEGYPGDEKLITLFNNDNIIYDGQHRAGCLFYLYGDIKVPVRRLYFKNHKYSMTENGEEESTRIEAVTRTGETVKGKYKNNANRILFDKEVMEIRLHEVNGFSDIVLDISDLVGEKESLDCLTVKVEE